MTKPDKSKTVDAASDLDSITELHGGRVFNLRAIPLTACQLGPLLALSRHQRRR